MLLSLTAENVALIERVEIGLSQGLNILSGETGAGKSMIIDSLLFLLGSRAPKDFLRQGARRAYVSCVIECEERNLAALKEIFEYIDDDNIIVIERTLSADGKSACKINGKTAAVGVLKDIAALMFDIHGQHEHQKLLNPARHINILDIFCPSELADELSSLNGLLKELRAIDAETAELTGGGSDRESLIDLYRFQTAEIEQADLKPGEEEQLTERRRVINNAEEIAENANAAVRAIAGGGSAASALDMLISGQKALIRLSKLDASAEPYAEIIDEIIIKLDDLGRDLRSYKSGLSHDPYELKEIEERLDTLYNLKRKYGRTVDEILAFYDKTKAKLDIMENADARLAELGKKRAELSADADNICGRITAIRKTAAAAITAEIEENLRELDMKNAVFSVKIDKSDDFTANGRDKVEFLLSANAGEPEKPLAQVASGGEVSRVMLALKSVLSKADPAATYIFDEIDTGVSGRAAQKVAQKLKSLSRGRQLLCITHLPQIAAFADTHILIEKSAADGKTVTNAHNLDEDGTRREIARLIGGAYITEQTKKAAAELREMAVSDINNPEGTDR